MTKGKQKSFQSWEELQNLSQEALHPYAEDFLYDFAISTVYEKAVKSQFDFKKPPFLEVILFDYFYFGYCISISFEALRNYLIETGEMQKDDIDSDFYSILWFKVIVQKS